MPNLIKFIHRHRRKLLALFLWVSIFVMVRTVMIDRGITVNDVADELVSLLRDAWYGSALFIILYIMRPLLLIPGTIMNLMSGMIYGVPAGIAISITANGLSAIVTYFVSRWFIHTKIEASGRRGRLLDFMRRNPFEAIVTMQLTYLSIDIISSLAGVLHLPFRQFILGILIGGAVGNILGVTIGSSIEGSIVNGSLTIQPEMILISVVVLMISLGFSNYLRERSTSLFL